MGFRDRAGRRNEPRVRQEAALAAERIAKGARTIPDLNLDLVWIAPGDFMMGSPPAPRAIQRWIEAAQEKIAGVPAPGVGMEDNERPETFVKLTEGFWLGRTEVTQAQWQALMATDPSHFKGRELPVEMVYRWVDAKEFCRKTDRNGSGLANSGRLPAGFPVHLADRGTVGICVPRRHDGRSRWQPRCGGVAERE